MFAEERALGSRQVSAQSYGVALRRRVAPRLCPRGAPGSFLPSSATGMLFTCEAAHSPPAAFSCESLRRACWAAGSTRQPESRFLIFMYRFLFCRHEGAQLRTFVPCGASTDRGASAARWGGRIPLVLTPGQTNGSTQEHPLAAGLQAWHGFVRLIAQPRQENLAMRSLSCLLVDVTALLLV